MGNDSRDKSNQVKEDKNNDNRGEKPTDVSLERHRNNEKDSLANRKQESQCRMTKRKRKRRKQKVSTSREYSDSLSPSPAKEKESQTWLKSPTGIVIFLNCQ